MYLKNDKMESRAKILVHRDKSFVTLIGIIFEDTAIRSDIIGTIGYNQ